LLKLAIIHVTDIPEKDLVYLLKYLISHESQFSEKKKEKKTPSIRNLFSLIICAPRSDNKMMKALKKLNEDELLFIFKIFCEWTKKHGDNDIIPEIMFDTAKAALLEKTKNIPDFHFVSFNSYKIVYLQKIHYTKFII